jgi:hypothetical protein
MPYRSRHSRWCCNICHENYLFLESALDCESTHVIQAVEQEQQEVIDVDLSE